MSEARVIGVTIRDDGYDEEWDAEELHLECRFENGEKYAAVVVDGSKPELARIITDYLNSIAPSTEEWPINPFK